MGLKDIARSNLAAQHQSATPCATFDACQNGAQHLELEKLNKYLSTQSDTKPEQRNTPRGAKSTKTEPVVATEQRTVLNTKEDRLRAIAAGLVDLESKLNVQIPHELEAKWNAAASAEDEQLVEFYTLRIVGELKGLDGGPVVPTVATTVAQPVAMSATERNREKRAPW